MKKTITILLLSALLPIVSRCAYSKHCYGDGVCKVVENGQERLEGSPEDVAKHVKKEKEQAVAAAELQAKYDKAEKRGLNAKSRVALFVPRGMNQELADLSAEYYRLIASAFQGDPQIEIVDQSLVEEVLKQTINPQGFSFTSQKDEPDSKEVVTQMRDKGLFADIIVFTRLQPKEFYGYISKNGVQALVGLEHVQLLGTVSSIYTYQPFQFSAEGKSSNSLAVAGLGQDKKFANGQMKLKRNVMDDQAAVQTFVDQIRNTIKAEIAPKLPTAAAIEKIQGTRAISSESLKSIELLKGLFSH